MIPLFRIAAPLIAAYFAEMAMLQTTKVVVGELGYLPLAAVGLAADLVIEIAIIFMGVLSIVGVLSAQAVGAGRDADAGNAARQGAILALALGIFGGLLVWRLDAVMALLGQEPEVVEAARPFLWGMIGFLAPTLLFAVLRNFVAALSRAGAVMVVSALAVALNYVLTRWFVFGGVGLPAMGVYGAGVALTVTAWAMLIALLLTCWLTPSLRGYGLFRARLRLDPPICREILVLGAPIGVMVLFEGGLFIAVVVFSGQFGAKALAATQVVISYSALPFVVALGLAEATMIRVAHAVGRSDRAGARLEGVRGAAVALALVSALVVVPLTASDLITRVYLSPDDPGFAEVSALTASLFMIAAFFQVFDALQVVAARALRALKDTIAPLIAAAFGYWAIGVAGGWSLAFPLGMGPVGVWWGLAFGLMITSVMLSWRFLRLTAPGPAGPGARGVETAAVAPHRLNNGAAAAGRTSALSDRAHGEGA